MQKEETICPLDVFLHIPKTGGKSIENLLTRNYNAKNTASIYRRAGAKTTLEIAFGNIPKQRKQKIELLYGHIPHGIERYVNRKCRYFTFLRNPVSRIISSYFFVKYDFKAHELHEELYFNSMTLLDYVKRQDKHQNLMTKMLSGTDVLDQLKSNQVPKALENLAHMPAFGIQEYFNKSCVLISKVFDWEIPLYQRTNVSTINIKNHSEEIPHETIEEIKKLNEQDIELYDAAVELFSRRCIEHGVTDEIVSEYERHLSEYQYSIDSSNKLIERLGS